MRLLFALVICLLSASAIALPDQLKRSKAAFNDGDYVTAFQLLIIFLEANKDSLSKSDPQLLKAVESDLAVAENSLRSYQAAAKQREQDSFRPGGGARPKGGGGTYGSGRELIPKVFTVQCAVPGTCGKGMEKEPTFFLVESALDPKTLTQNQLKKLLAQSSGVDSSESIGSFGIIELTNEKSALPILRSGVTTLRDQQRLADFVREREAENEQLKKLLQPARTP